MKVVIGLLCWKPEEFCSIIIIVCLISDIHTQHGVLGLGNFGEFGRIGDMSFGSDPGVIESWNLNR